jgi:RimJ/RimL family protein N-acetyltransferase
LIITTDRLRLRPMERKDIADFVRELGDWEVQQWLWVPPFPYRYEDGEAFLAIVRNNHMTSHPTVFVIADKESDAALGVTSVDINAAGTGALGYWLARAHWGRGFVKDATRALLRHAVGHPALRQLIAVTDPENLRSQRVLTALGFRDHGLHCRPAAARLKCAPTNSRSIGIRPPRGDAGSRAVVAVTRS